MILSNLAQTLLRSIYMNTAKICSPKIKNLNLILRHIFKIIISLATLNFLTGFTELKKGDLIELTQSLNLRQTPEFFKRNKNIITLIPQNTKGQVKIVKQLPSGNFGVCIRLLNFSTHIDGASGKSTDIENSEDCYWIYYNKKQSALNLHSFPDEKSKNRALLKWSQEKKINEGTVGNPSRSAVVTRPSSSIADSQVRRLRDGHPVSPAKATSEAPSEQASLYPKKRLTNYPTVHPNGSDGSDHPSHNTSAASAAETIARINEAVTTSPSLTCPTGNCSGSLSPAEPLVRGNQCASNNSYLKNRISELLSDQKLKTFFEAPQKEIISLSCIKRNMDQFVDSPQYFQTCGSNGKAHSSPQACIDDDYLKATSKSFNLAADCLGDFLIAKSLSGGLDDRTREIVKKQTSLSVFSLMAQESGMHINAVSSTGSAGPGQMTPGAIQDVNQNISRIKNHLTNSKNPSCKNTLMTDLQKLNSGEKCERISPEKMLSAMFYPFAYQALINEYLDKSIFSADRFKGIISDQLPVDQLTLFKTRLAAWGHNTGPNGIKVPIQNLLASYRTKGKTISNKQDIDNFFKELKPYVARANRKRQKETSQYFGKIQDKVKIIAPTGVESCLAH